MLNHLHVRNLAVVDEVEVELGSGMTVLTGETGAGKSILVDALALALGARADADAVRPGAKRAEITASFTPEQKGAAGHWLTDNDLDEGDDCVIRRVVSSEGRSRGYINGNPVPMQTLRELGELLVDICGQQAHQSLSRTDNQRNLLDQHGNHGKLLADVRIAYDAWHKAQADYAELDAARADQSARLELLSFQVQELDNLSAQPGELAQLEQTHRKAANSNRLVEGAGAALGMLYENETGNAQELVGRAQTLVQELAELDSSLQPLDALLTEASIQIGETVDTLRNYLSQDDADPQQLAELDARLGIFHDLARKHRVNPDELPDLTTKLQTDLHAIENVDDTLDKLRAEAETNRTNLDKLCKKLSAARKKAAVSLAKEVTANMQQLGMADGRFNVSIENLPTPGPGGAERIEFLVALNPGLPPGALNKVASGGELSRVSLAIQVASSDRANTPTLIFDEVDAGVGGGTADIVGEKLRSLTPGSQVLCVTHLPQVASKGHEHFRVAKLSDGHNTRTRVAPLKHDERIEELARMLGGVKITKRTREHAAEMLGLPETKLSAG